MTSRIATLPVGLDQTTPNTTATDINFLEFPVEAGKRYIVQGVIYVGGALSGTRFAAVITGGGKIRCNLFSRSTTDTAFRRQRLVTLNTLTAAVQNQTGVKDWDVEISGMIEVDADGVFKLQYASANAAQESTISSFGTYVQLIEVQ